MANLNMENSRIKDGIWTEQEEGEKIERERERDAGLSDERRGLVYKIKIWESIDWKEKWQYQGEDGTGIELLLEKEM